MEETYLEFKICTQEVGTHSIYFHQLR